MKNLVEYLVHFPDDKNRCIGLKNKQNNIIQ